MRLLCLDLATRIGFAVRDAAGRVSWGHRQLPEACDDIGLFLHKYDVWLCDMLIVHAPDLVVYEAPWVDGKTHQVTALKLMNLAGHTAWRCGRKRVRSKPANISAVRAAFIGTSRMKRDEAKRATIQACKLRGWNVGNDDDAADALAVLEYEAGRLKLDGVIAGPLFAERAA